MAYAPGVCGGAHRADDDVRLVEEEQLGIRDETVGRALRDDQVVALPEAQRAVVGLQGPLTAVDEVAHVTVGVPQEIRHRLRQPGHVDGHVRVPQDALPPGGGIALGLLGLLGVLAVVRRMARTGVRPAHDLILAFFATLLLIIFIHIGRLMPGLGPSLGLLARMAQYGVLINLVLAFFNLIPIPPLDGSHVLYHLLPPRLGMAYRSLQQYGMLILLAVMFLARPIFSLLLAPAFFLYSLAMYVVQLWT